MKTNGDVEFVKRGYADLFEKDEMKGYAKRCLNFVVKFYNNAELCKAIRVVDSYNNFNGSDVANAVCQLQDSIIWGEFGREGSPVLYLTLGTGVQIAPIKNMFNNLQADEIHFSNGRLRIWWD